jgi:glycosyltransferase involved in cell wall biosynthesis
LRIALVYQSVGRGTVDWSGVPAGLERGLRALGHEPMPIPLGIPQALRRATDALALARYRRRGLGAMTAPAVRWRTRLAHRDREPADGVVLMGTTFEIPRTIPYVTYDDMTVPQFARLQQLPEAIARPWRERQARALDGAVACCVTGGWVAASLVEHYGVEPARIARVGIGANTVSPPVEDRDWSIPRFVFVGVDWERKGGRHVVDAFRDLRRGIPEATLDLVGPTPEIAEPGVTVHGRLPIGSAALLAVYRRATCLVMPSRFEPFAIVHAEAGMAGVGSIGTTQGGVSEVIGPGGMTVDPGDHDRLVRAMTSFADPDTARRLGGLAREHAQRFTWENVARSIVARLVPAFASTHGSDGRRSPPDGTR